MAATDIEWTDATWNPVAGCSIVSMGCTNCYAMNLARRLEAMGVPKYGGLTRKSGQRSVWNGVVREDHNALRVPHSWKKPHTIFVNSMSDLSLHMMDPTSTFSTIPDVSDLGDTFSTTFRVWSRIVEMRSPWRTFMLKSTI
jgi:protein gp37